jgi:putative glutathione S-transferase
MVEGEWRTDWYEPDEEGRFQRPDTVFRNWVRRDGSSPHEPEEGRYHLYVAWACPWANRTLIARTLKGLEDAIDVSIVHPFMGENGWEFHPDAEGCTEDRLFDSDYLYQVYRRADAHYTGRVTVPVLWDKKLNTIVNNESKEIIRMFDLEFDEFATGGHDLFPADIRSDVDEAIEEIYEPINNGVYRAGFAGTQSAYEEAVTELFGALDKWETVLSKQRYMCGDRLTAADICLFTTLFRFDIVYYTHFKCNVRQIRDYPNLWNFVLDMYQTDGIAETTNIDHTKRHYFGSHETINPKRIVPVGPRIRYDAPHDRDRFS